MDFVFFISFWNFTHTKQMQQSKIKINKNNAYKEMHDAQIYEDKTSNA